MSVSEQFRAVGGSATTISDCQDKVADHVVSELQCSEEVKEQVRELLLGKTVRTIIAQCLLDTYVEGLKVGRGERR